MRPNAGVPTMSKRTKRVLIALVSLGVLGVLWFQFVGVYVNWLWFGEVGFREVFTTQVLTRVVLFLIAGLGAAAVVFLCILMAYRSRPVFVPTGEADPLAPYRALVTGRPRLITLVLSGVVGLVAGLSAQSEWDTVQLFMHGGSFGTSDAQFQHDVGFYVFKLPFIQMILSWLFVATVIGFVAALVTHYLFGGIRLSGPGRRITTAATLQLSLLIGAFVLLKAVQYWFDRYSLLFSNRGGSFTGASYTDVNAVLPAKIILMVIAAICAVGFIVGAFLRSVKLPAIALGLLVLASVLIGGVWPLVLQQVVVNPNGISREPPYIQRNLDATKAAYGMDDIEYIDYPGTISGNPLDVAEDEQTIPNARLLDPNVLNPTFTQQQQLENFYGFPAQLSVDRYNVDGTVQDYVVAARELNAGGLAENQRNWINEHMVFTHGNGFVAAPANTVQNGYPEYTVSDLFQQGDIPVDQPRTYYGQLTTDYAIVGAEEGGAPREYDTRQSNYTYTGQGGVHLGNLFQRLVFATQYGEANFLFSSEINGNSKIMYNRDPADRVESAAPFLTTDTKPYPAVVGGRIVWIVDAYTTATNYPYSQNVTLSDATQSSLVQARGAQGQVAEQVSYIRNSVKATVDAYDGTVTLYAVDESDPVLQAWRGIFPDLVQPNSAVSDDLRAHFRYPQDLFEVQRYLLQEYHLTGPDAAVQFFQSSGFWRVPNDPTVNESTAGVQPPYYLQVQIPGQETAQFELTSVLLGFQREFMSAYLSANSDPADYGKLTVLRLPDSTQTPGPQQVQQLFRSTQQVSERVTLSTQTNGSQVIFGNLLTLPVNDGLLYVEPFYIQTASRTSFPQLNWVLVWYGGRVGVGTTLRLALEDAAESSIVPVEGDTGNGGQPGTGTESTPPTSPSTQVPLPADAAEAQQDLTDAVAAMDQARQSGDLGRIGTATEQLEQAVKNYLQVVERTQLSNPGTTPSETTTEQAPAGG
ncbi:UPF0182 family membrane protein [Nakamurella leprariae]|nr:UPF0182 family protein [Nakamurella leprariae]